MSSSFVAIKDKGFWMNDSWLELWLRLLALHVMYDSEKEEEIVKQIWHGWITASVGYFGGFVPDNLDEYVATESGKRVVQRAINSLLTALRSSPKFLDHQTLNLLGIKRGTFVSDVETSRLIEIGHAFQDLIDGKIQGDSRSTDYMPGSTVTS